MKIDEIPASWNREKVSVRAELRLHSGFDRGSLKSTEIPKN